jgi:hypothetical protein
MEIKTRDDVGRLLDAPLSSAAVAAALELGLFWTFDDGPRSARSVADELHIPEVRCRFWLRTLASLGLLDETEEGFYLSPTGRSAIVEGWSREAWRYLAIEAREASPLVVDLARRLDRRGPVTDDAVAITDYVDKLRADPDRARRFTELLYELHSVAHGGSSIWAVGPVWSHSRCFGGTQTCRRSSPISPSSARRDGRSPTAPTWHRGSPTSRLTIERGHFRRGST